MGLSLSLTLPLSISFSIYTSIYTLYLTLSSSPCICSQSLLLRLYQFIVVSLTPILSRCLIFQFSLSRFLSFFVSQSLSGLFSLSLCLYVCPFLSLSLSPTTFVRPCICLFIYVVCLDLPISISRHLSSLCEPHQALFYFIYLFKPE